MADRRFYSAAVCSNGHVETSAIEFAGGGDIAVYCAECGATVLRGCPACEKPIRGLAAGMGSSGIYRPPDFCVYCAEPFPWISRAGTIHQLQRIVDESGAPEADRLRAKEQLEALMDPELDEEEQATRWARFVKAVPSVWNSDAAQRMVAVVLEAGTRAMVDRRI